MPGARTMTRWLRPPDLSRARAAFDPLAELAPYKLSRELGLAIWDRVRSELTDSAGRLTPTRLVGACTSLPRMRLYSDVGRVTRVGVELEGVALGAPDPLSPRVPGRETLVAVEAMLDPPGAMQ